MGSLATRLCLLLALAALLPACGEEPSGARGTLPPGPPAGVEPPVPESAPAVLSIPVDAPVVVFLGDSLAAGMGLSAEQAFPAVLQRRLHAAGVPFRLVNAGVSGNTTAAGLARVDWILKQDPYVVVVELGANDGFRGLSLEATEKNLRGILKKVRAHGATPLLLGMKLPPNYGAQYAGAFDALYARVAKETGVAYVPFFMQGVGGVPAMNLSDGIHPTAEGHRKLAANLHERLRALLGP